MKNPALRNGNLAILLIPLLTFSGVNALAAEQESAPGPGVLEGFSCTYNAGKDRDDLDAATKFYLQQTAKAGLTAPVAYLWTLSNGNVPFNLVWVNVHESMSAFAASNDAFEAASEMDAVDARYNDVVTCQPGLALATGVFQSDSAPEEPERALLGTYACNVRNGMGPAAVASVSAHIAELNEGMGDEALEGVAQIVPFTQGPNSPDVIFLAIAKDMTDFANHMDALTTTPAGQAASAHFNSVLDCSTALWRAERVVGGG